MTLKSKLIETKNWGKLLLIILLRDSPIKLIINHKLSNFFTNLLTKFIKLNNKKG